MEETCASYGFADDFIEAWDLFWDQLKEDLSYFFDEDEIPETPYLFKVKERIYDKRPHKQHRIRNSCRKERSIWENSWIFSAMK